MTLDVNYDLKQCHTLKMVLKELLSNDFFDFNFSDTFIKDKYMLNTQMHL